MKRFLVAILAIIYFSISSGVVMNIHYCMGKKSSVQLSMLPSKNCLCGKKTTSGCCKTEAKLVKLENDQKASYAGYTINPPVAVAVIPLSLLQASSYTTQTHVSPQLHAPPLLSVQDTYLRNCVFRI